MASTYDFASYVCDQICDAGDIRMRKMFGEYMIYLNDKPVLLVCDNTVYIKKLDILADLMKNAPTGYPYEGAKLWYILDIDNRELCVKAVLQIEPFLKVQIKKKRKKRLD